MAGSWRDRAAQSGAAVAAPAGYNQNLAKNGPANQPAEQAPVDQGWRAQAAERGAAVPAGATKGNVAWGTGGNIEDIENSWNTPFYQKYFEQIDESTKRGDLFNLYDRDDFTGVVTRDQKSQNTKHDDYKFGDIYQNGVKQGNLYDGTTYDQHGADWIMGRLTLDSKVFAEAKTPEQLAREVERVRNQAAIDAEKGVGAQLYQSRTEGRLQEWSNPDNFVDDAAVVGSGIAGGAATGFGAGAAVGSVLPGVGTAIVGLGGAIIGSIVGGVSSWLNRDEIIEGAARASVQTEMANEQGNGFAGASQAAYQWSALAGRQLSPLGNLTRGLYDNIEGTAGDQKAEWYATDPVTGESTRAWGWDLANFASIVPDSLGTFGSKAGLTAFKLTMGGTVAGQVGSYAAMGGQTFDETRGGFDQTWTNDEGELDVVSGFAGLANVGINAAQLGGASALFKAADDAKRLFGNGAELAANTSTKVQTGGWTYTLNEAGQATKRTLNMGVFAPSEFLTGLSASMMVRAGNKATQAGFTAADDIYRMTQSLQNGARPYVGTLVNAMGEGYEEGIQAVLEPVSHNADIDWAEVGVSALTGGLMGTGMGMAANLQGASQEQRIRMTADRVRVASSNGALKPFTDAEWNKMSDIQKRAATTAPPEIQEGIAVAEQNLRADQTVSVAANFYAPEKKHAEAALARATQEMANAAPKTDLAFRITQNTDADFPGNGVSASINRVRDLIGEHAKGLEIAASSEQDPALRAALEAAAGEGAKLQQALALGAQRYSAALNTQDRRAEVVKANQLIANWFNADPDAVDPQTNQQIDDNLRMARARAATMILTRDPIDNVGSFQALIPVVSESLSQYGSDHVLQVGHGILKPLGGDFDGDKLRQQARLVINQEAFTAARQGAGYINVNGTVNIGTRHYEEGYLTLLGDAWASDPKGPFYSAARAVEKQIADTLRSRYSMFPQFEGILQSFLQDLRAGDQKAREKFLNAMSLNMGSEVADRSLSQLSNDWIWMDDVIQRGLQSFNRAMAGRQKPKALNLEMAAPVQQTADINTRRMAAAATEGQTLAQRLRGSEMFRLFQALRYSSYRSNVLQTETDNNLPIAELTRFFNMLGEGMVTSEMEAKASTDEVTSRVAAKIRAISEASREADGSFTPEAVLANVEVPNVDSDGTFYPGQITLAQSLLREEVRLERIKYSEVLDSDTTIQARLNKLDSLTKPGGKRSKTAGAAFVEVYRATPLFELLGSSSAGLGVDLTVGQYADNYFDRSSRGRRETARLLRAEPEYLGRKEGTNVPYGTAEVDKGEVSRYRSVVDSILDASNHKLTVQEGGADAGTPRGEIATRSDKTGKQIRGTVEAFHDVLRQLNLAPTRENVLQVMRDFPDWGTALLELIPNRSAAAFFRTVDAGNGQTNLVMAPWLADAMTLPPEEAELAILRNLILLTFNGQAIGTDVDDTGANARAYDRLTDRFHRILYQLNFEPDSDVRKGEFLRVMAESKSVAEFIREVNKHFLGDEPPVVAWVRDTAEFDADKVGGGWSQILDGATEREAVTTLLQRTQRLVKGIEQERNVDVADATIWRALERAREAERNGTAVEGSADAVYLQRLRGAIDTARNMISALGPRTLEAEAIEAYLTFSAYRTDKGRVTPGTRPIGARDSQLDSFATNYEVTRASLTTRSLETLAASPQIAARGELSVMDSDGVPIVFDGLDEDFIIDNWQDPAARTFIRNVLFPSVIEPTPDGQNISTQYLVGNSLAELLSDNGSLDRLFRKNNTDQYLSYIEATATVQEDENAVRHGIPQVINDIILTRTTLAVAKQNTSDAQRAYREVSRGVAEVLKVVGDIASRPGTDMEEFREAVRESLHKGYVGRALDLGTSDIEREISTSLENSLSEARLEIVRLSKEGATDTAAAREIEANMLEAALSEDPLQIVMAMFEYDPSSATAASRRDRLASYVKVRPNLGNKAPWAREAIRKLQNADGTMIIGSDGLPRLTPDEWVMVSRAVIGDTLERASGVSTSDELGMPVFPDYRKPAGRAMLKYWDPSFADLYEPLLQGGLVTAAARLHTAARRTHRGSVKTAARVFDMQFTDKTGRWTADLPGAQQEATERLKSSGAEPQISMAGMGPARNAGLSAAWTRTHVQTGLSELYSKTPTLTADIFLSGNVLDTSIPVTLPNGNTTQSPLASLNGRWVRRLVVNGQELVLGPGSYPQPVVGQSWNGDPNSVYAEGVPVTLQQIQNAVRWAVGKGDPEKVSVEIEFLHPDAQPNAGGYTNNVYFEGLAKQNLTADVAPSLPAAFWVSPGGNSPVMQQQALQANKTGSFAIMLSTTFSREQQLLMETGWAGNFAGMLRTKTKALLGADNGTGPLDPINWNAVYKELKMSHFVRGLDANDTPVLWTADQVIAWQNENPGQELPLTNAELWMPSDPVLRRLYGDTRDQAEISVMAQLPEVDYSQFPRFTGTFGPKALADIKGALTVNPDGTWLQRSILETYAAVRRPHSHFVPAPALSEATESKWARGMRVLSEERNAIHQARFESKQRGDFKDLSDKAYDFAAAPLTRGLASFNWGNTRAPFVPSPTVGERDLKRAILNEVASAERASDNRMAWIYREDATQGPGRAGGVLSWADIERPGHSAMSLAPDDVVVVDVASFRGDMEKAFSRLQAMMDRGAIIHLVSATGARGEERTLATFILESADYAPIGSSPVTFERTRPESRLQNVNARNSALLEERGMSAAGAALIYSVRDTFDENSAAAIEANQDISGDVSLEIDLIPLLPFKDFSAPVSPTSVAKVKAQIQGLYETSEGRKYLAKQAGVADDEAKLQEFADALDKLVDRWKASPDSASILPSGDWKRGDIVPLWRERDGAVLLYRHGNKAPSRKELEAALEVDDMNVAVYSPDWQPGATVHEGRIESTSKNGKYGLRSKMWVPLKNFGNKLQLELSGMKYVVTTLGQDIKLPEARFFQNWGIDYMTDSASQDSKNAWTGRVSNHRWAFAVYGIDTEPELVEFFTGATPSSAGYAAAVTRTRNILQQLSDTLPTLNVTQLERASANGQFHQNLYEVLSDHVQEAMTDADWLTALDPAADFSAEADAERRAALAGIAQATILYLMAPSAPKADRARYTRVLRSGGLNHPGARSSGLQSQLMAPLYTEFYDHMPFEHPTRRLLLDKMNAQVGKTSETDGWLINPDFTVTSQVAGDPSQTRTGWITVAEVYSSGDNPATDAMAHERGETQSVSQSTQNVASMALDARVAFTRGPLKANAVFGREGIVDFDADTSIYDLLGSIPDEPPTRQRNLPNPAEQEYVAIASDVVGTFRQLIDKDAWKKGYSKSEHNRNLNDWNEKARPILRKLGLKDEQEYLLHYWVRQLLGMPADADPKGTEGRVSYALAIDALGEIGQNIDNGWLPTTDGEVPMLHYSDLAVLYRASQRGGSFIPRTSIDTNDRVSSWNDWIDVALALGETRNAVFDAMFLTATDGMLHSYIGQEDSLVGLPVSRDDLRRAELFDPKLSQFVVSLDPFRNQTVGETEILNQAYRGIGDRFGAQRVGARWAGKLPPTSAIQKRRSARKTWRKNRGIASPAVTNIRNFRQYGAQWREEQTTTNAFVRVVTDLRVGMAMWNPLLWVSAGVELGVRGALETTTNLLLGQGTGVAGNAAAAISGGKWSVYTDEQRAAITKGIKDLGSRSAFKGMVYSELMFHREKGGNSIIERGSRAFARAGSYMQDPTWGLKGTVLSRRYVESALQWIAANPTETVVSVEKVISSLVSDPTWLHDNIRPAHDAALASIANLRSLKPTPVSKFISGIYEPLSKHPNLAINTIANLGLRIPLIFSNYAINVGTNITGLQAPMAMLATVLNGRKNPMAGIQSWLAGDGYNRDDVNFDMSTVLEGLDLSKAMLQGAITHTSLFALGMAAGGLGLTGGDEEERRRKKAMKYQTGQIVYDPRDIINDFRNADSVYLDWLPFGMGGLFSIPDPSNVNSSQSMANVHWILRQFVSPILGFERALETGDVRHIMWGFQDAIGSMPLVNTASWTDASDTFARLIETAPDTASAENLDATLDAWGTVLTGVAYYERMLLENSFVNMLYQQADRYDRDPWVLPKTDVDGNIIRPRLDQPVASDALEDYVDPITGEVQQGRKGFDWWDATLHGFSENRGTLALMFSLFSGNGLGGSTIRTNMVPKTRTIDKAELEGEEAAVAIAGLFQQSGGFDAASVDGDPGLILSTYDAMGREVLNENGAAAVIHGIWKGSVQPGSPALEGVFITKETREAIQANLMTAIIQEGVDMGLSDFDAKGRMYDIWYGPKDDPEVRGFGDILFDKDIIPYSQSEQYLQLNTTYVIGPDGRPWATGVARDNLSTMFGFAPVNRFMRGDVGLNVDGSLNSVDDARGINTGLRGLEKVDDSWDVPTPEEIGKSIEDAMKDAMGKSYSSNKGDTNGGYGYGRRYGGGGGGGGGGGRSYPYKLNGPERNDAVYARQTPFVNVDNPMIRRATIRRERFSSERGRLNQWQ
ncbi:hypothetical protein SEA_HANNABELLA_27 [Microbacterium phage Hannabella]|nr:hypothetical protein SEA_HANNABELLA_27 [Microbacterium phage Hannabella]